MEDEFEANKAAEVADTTGSNMTFHHQMTLSEIWVWGSAKRFCALAVPRTFRGTDDGRRPHKILIYFTFWWAHKGSNLGPLPCEGNALPLSYAPGRVV